ncbi:hypothetical protein Oter_1203 [Opitutus terrae PB90-1]|uniref:Lipoprotein n=2 Tax=Opitutus terrae TaxID=107709 RepID=B1ZPH0_OPITP|nr:hypothetical protein Oter_1203 [Opitutus terrae PB90-1]
MAMKLIRPLIFMMVLTALVGCTDQKAEAETAKQEAAAKAQAEAAKTEMQKLPQTFKPRHDRKLTPSKDTDAGKVEPKK